MEANEWKAAMGHIVDVAQDCIGREKFPPDAPETLFHFTDASGLVGVLRSKSIWAGLGQSTNDRSEISWAIDRARVLLPQETSIDAAFGSLVCHYFDTDNSPPPWRVDFHPYLVSFCARIDRSVHWLHYGRSGTGYAMGFASEALRGEFWTLARVIYDLDQLDAFIRKICNSVYAKLKELMPSVSSSLHQKLWHMAAHATAGFITAVAVRYKNPSFENEGEWRLIILDAEHRLESPSTTQFPTDFRAAAGRVVPYKAIPFSVDAVKEIVLGHSAPMDVKELSLTLLLRATLGRVVPISRSEVPVRP